VVDDHRSLSRRHIRVVASGIVAKGSDMRETFHNELIEQRALLGEMCRLAASAMRLATEALLSADREKAGEVRTADATLDKMRDQCEERAQQMLALQAPVAGDLRIVLASIYCAEKVERMGDLAEHVASTTCREHPEEIVPPELRDTFHDLGEITTAMAEQLMGQVAQPRPGAFAELNEIDHQVDALHAAVLREITAPTWQHGVRTATCLALLARFYERFADQAVSVAKRVEFVSTGQTPLHPSPH
jgi:phosphate transport system protein